MRKLIELHKRPLWYNKINFRRNIITAIIFTTVFLAFGLLYIRFSWNKYEKLAQKDAYSLAESLGLMIDVNHIRALSGSEEDLNKAEYIMYKNKFKSLKNGENRINNVYLLRLESDRIITLIDAEEPTSEIYSPPGQVYAEAEREYWESFKSKKTMITSPVKDRWGTWISVLVPITEPFNEEVSAVFGIDYSSTEWYLRIWKQVIPDIIIIITLLFLFLTLVHTRFQQSMLKWLSKKLQYDEALYHGVFNQAPIGIGIVDNKNFVIQSEYNDININPIFEKIIGRSKSNLKNITWEDITHPDDLGADLGLFKRFKFGEIDGYSMEKRFIKPDRSSVWTKMTVSSLEGIPDGKDMHLCLLEDISLQKEAEDKLRYAVEHDPWTGLYNRDYLENILEKDSIDPLEGNRAIIGINLNTMYLLSLVYDFNYSQDLLKKVASALKNHSNENCQLFSSYEYRFVFYIKNYKDSKDLMKFCQDISSTINSIISKDRIGGGIGVIEITENNKADINQILKNVLVATERALKSDSNNVSILLFDEEMSQQIMREDYITRELIEIAQGIDSSRLFLQFQPIFDIKSKKITEFEALSRLKSNKYGFVSPVEFISLAEKRKIIISLGEVITYKALEFLKSLEKNGYRDIGVSINVSVIQLLSDNFINHFINTIRELDVNPLNVGIELTESILMDNYDEINKLLGVLKSLGIKIAIDDFGTGYSSLAREGEINANGLKIDKSFIDKLMYLDYEHSITSDIISMGHKMGHYVIAEGVEHEKQLEFLAKHGCNKAQGYLISKPLDEKNALDIFKDSKNIL